MSRYSNIRLRCKKGAFAATGTDYLAFGNGHQAYPADPLQLVIKLMLAYALVYYNLEIIDSRPPDRWIGVLRMPCPASNAKLRN